MSLDSVKQFVANSKLAQFGLVFFAGLLLGALFYPTKHIETKTKQTYEQQISQIKDQHLKEVQSLQETIDKQSKEKTTLTQTYDQKVASLTTQVSTLQSKKKTTYYKIVKPDGTVIVKKASEDQTDESSDVVTQVQQEYQQKLTELQTKLSTEHDQKVQDLQKQWDSKEQDYQKTIATLEQSKVVDINKKSFGLGLGALTNGDYFLQGTADLIGPIYIGAQVQAGASSALGALVGLHF